MKGTISRQVAFYGLSLAVLKVYLTQAMPLDQYVVSFD
jgi:hypothetical protein